MNKLIITVFSVMLLLFQSLMAFSAPYAEASEFIFVANRSVAQDTLTKDEIKYIYLGRKKKWDDGSQITFAVFQSKIYQQDFVLDLTGKTSEQFRHYWQQNVFTGNGQMPPVFDNPQNLIDFISKKEGSIGYVPAGIQTGDLKRIEIR